MTLPTTAQIEALGLSEIEAHAVVSALVLLEHVPAEKLSHALSAARVVPALSGVPSSLLDAALALRRLLPERPAARRVDDKGARHA